MGSDTGVAAGIRGTAAGGPVLVVGAGAAGLAVAAQLKRRGVAAEVLERNPVVASAWRDRYDRLRLNTSRFTSALPGARFARGTPLFPARDDLVGYLERYASANDLAIQFGVTVDRVEAGADGWQLSTSAGPRVARQVIMAVGYQHTPRLPGWASAGGFGGRVLHSAAYRNPADFSGADVLVAGAGSSGLEIAYDLAVGGAATVRLAVRTQPNILLRESGGLPGDLPAMLLLKLPPRFADRAAGFVRRRTVGDLSRWGLTPPQEGVASRERRDGKVPAIVDRTVLTAVKDGLITVVAGVSSAGPGGVELADGTVLNPDVVIAATGYGTGLEPIVGHLGLLDERGVPLVHGGAPAAPGLRFLGYVARPGQVGSILGHEARRAAREVSGEVAAPR